MGPVSRHRRRLATWLPDGARLISVTDEPGEERLVVEPADGAWSSASSCWRKAVRDVRPVYYERYMIDYNNTSPDVQQAARDRIHWFFSVDYAGRRQYSENIATDIYYEQLTFAWPNWAKLFFNNKGVAARSTDVCEQYPPNDQGVWNW